MLIFIAEAYKKIFYIMLLLALVGEKLSLTGIIKATMINWN
jgi:hypothetical protein